MKRRAFLRQALTVATALTVGPTALTAPTSVVAANLTSTAPSPTSQQQTPSRDLVIAAASDITTLDPHESTVAADVRVTFNLFDTLVSRTPDLALKPSLATSWRLLDDRRWEFTLRDDARFHNGVPVTSRDVKFSIERALDGSVGTAVTTIFTTVEAIETPDDRTVVFITLFPDPLLPERLSYVGGQIVPERYVREVGNGAFARAPIGSGVVKFSSWTPGQQLVLDANPDYWGGPPDFDRAIFLPLTEPRDRVQKLLDRQAHIATRLAPEWLLRISRRPEAQPAEVLYAGLYILAVNTRVPILSDPRIRQALSLAVDRTTILKGMWLGRGLVPNGFVAKGDKVGYAAEWPALTYDQERARQLLAEAGYAGEQIIFEATDGYLENDSAMAIVLAAMWQQVGLNVRLEALSIAERARKVRARSFRGIWFSDPTSTIQDPDGMMVRLISPGGPLDYWYDEEWTHLAFEARYLLDHQRRDDIYRQMQQIMLREMPWIPIIQPTVGYGVSTAIQWQPHPTDRLELRPDTLRAPG